MDAPNFGKLKGRRKGGEELIYACPRCLKIKLEFNVRKKLYNCWSCGFSGKIRESNELLRKHGIFKVHHQDAWPEITIPGRTKLTSFGYHFLRSRGIGKERAKELGVCHSTEFRFTGRAIFPVIESRKTVCYIARAMDDRLEPKELAPPRDVSNRGNFLFGLDEVKQGDRVVIVEGIFDREYVRSLGYTCVAAMGSHLTEVQIGKLLAKRPEQICLMFDADPAGYKGMKDTMRSLYTRYHGLVSTVNCAVYNKKDPDELKPSEVKEALG